MFELKTNIYWLNVTFMFTFIKLNGVKLAAGKSTHKCHTNLNREFCKGIFINIKYELEWIVKCYFYFDAASLRMDWPSTWKWSDEDVGVILLSDFRWYDDLVVDVLDPLDDELANVLSDTTNKQSSKYNLMEEWPKILSQSDTNALREYRLHVHLLLSNCIH